MGGYKTVVVGTDGSDSSLRAVDRAGQLASGPDAKVIVASAYLPAPVYELLHDARDRATAAGATAVEERAIEGAPVDALLALVNEVGADVLVVGNVGLNTIAGRLLGSVPANVARRAKSDVLIVHTSE